MSRTCFAFKRSGRSCTIDFLCKCIAVNKICVCFNKLKDKIIFSGNGEYIADASVSLNQKHSFNKCIRDVNRCRHLWKWTVCCLAVQWIQTIESCSGDVFLQDKPRSQHPPGSLDKNPKGFSTGLRIIVENKLCDQKWFMIPTCCVQHDDLHK